MNLLRAIPRRMLPTTTEGDVEFCRRRFVQRHGREPDPEGGGRMTDLLYRIKTDGRLFDPLIQFVTDKEYAKQHVETVLGPGWTPETYAVLRTEDDIAAFEPPRVPCVLKPTHMSGPVMFHREPGAPVDRELLRRWLRKERYRGTREGNYRGLERKVIVEEFLSDDGKSVPNDYKLWCFRGRSKLIQVDSGRFGAHARNFYDVSWRPLPMTFLYPPGDQEEAPSRLAEMLDAATRLSSPFPFVRVDLYASANKVHVGELTFCPEGANAPVSPAPADFALAKMLDCCIDISASAEAWSNTDGSGGS